MAVAHVQLRLHNVGTVRAEHDSAVRERACFVGAHERRADAQRAVRLGALP